MLLRYFGNISKSSFKSNYRPLGRRGHFAFSTLLVMSSSLSSGTYQALEVTCRLLRSTQVTRTNTKFLALLFCLFAHYYLKAMVWKPARDSSSLNKSSEFEQCSFRKLE
ncbi:hypothetical protein CDAR_485531 [Caerostris darwini]|uniref:Uncharacterized protein n=1 Tax=Caerostris darwini TaxID=1538125 RepID=A0AAV4ULT2_9ARAC|nr:hypothetical protein CDAR_485531 [Caerostris darwini]